MILRPVFQRTIIRTARHRIVRPGHDRRTNSPVHSIGLNRQMTRYNSLQETIRTFYVIQVFFEWEESFSSGEEELENPVDRCWRAHQMWREIFARLLGESCQIENSILSEFLERKIWINDKPESHIIVKKVNKQNRSSSSSWTSTW